MGVWSQVILLSVRETELEEMNSHEREQNQKQNPEDSFWSHVRFKSTEMRGQAVGLCLDCGDDRAKRCGLLDAHGQIHERPVPRRKPE